MSQEEHQLHTFLGGSSWQIAQQLIEELDSPNLNQNTNHISSLLAHFYNVLVKEYFEIKKPGESVKSQDLEDEFIIRNQKFLDEFINFFWELPKNKLFERIKNISANKLVLSETIYSCVLENEDLIENFSLRLEVGYFVSANDILQSVLNRILLAPGEQYALVDRRLTELESNNTQEENVFLKNIREPENRDKLAVRMEMESINPQTVEDLMQNILAQSQENILNQKVIHEILKKCELIRNKLQKSHEKSFSVDITAQIEAVTTMEKMLLNTNVSPTHRLEIFHNQLQIEKRNALNVKSKTWPKFLNNLQKILGQRLTVSLHKHFGRAFSSHSHVAQFVRQVEHEAKTALEKPTAHPEQIC